MTITSSEPESAPESEPESARVAPVRIPVDRYTRAEFFELELERLWPRVWQLACPLDQVARPGDYYEYRCGPLSILVVRGDDGTLRAFQNACRHRGSAICEGSGGGLSELRCPFHRWTWSLAGELREVPSRRQYGVTNDELPLIPVLVDTWGPLVFVNCDLAAESLAEFLDPVPTETAWVVLDDFRCSAMVSIPARCNWKTLIDGFSETYHVQGIHREMLGMCDDVNGPQITWKRSGRLTQPYGVLSPRLGAERDRLDNAYIWEHFVKVMGVRVGADMESPGPCPAVHPDETMRDVLARLVVEHAATRNVDLSGYDVGQLLDMEQYNVFPNLTVLVFADMVQVVRSRPGATVTDAYMDAMSFERHRAGSTVPRAKPFDAELDPTSELPLGLVLNQDLANFARSQKGLHQPGLTHLTVSPTEECRIVNLHRNLEEYLDLSP
jgi:phenylpropionate dioxygenase-like ring-hydroxylating dioxygenase large terminal subunit